MWGRDILDRQESQGYGHRVIDRLSADLRERFPGTKSFSPRNLRNMRSFAESWPDLEIVKQAVSHLPWGHQIVVMQRLPAAEQRLFYVWQAIEHGWSRSILDLQIDRKLHERAGKAITNFVATLPPEDSDLVQQATKDPYLFDFVDSVDTLHERQIEHAIGVAEWTGALETSLAANQPSIEELEAELAARDETTIDQSASEEGEAK